MNIESDKYYTIAEVAAFLRQHPETIRRKIREGKFRIPNSLFPGKSILIHETDLQKYIQSISLSIVG